MSIRTASNLWIEAGAMSGQFRHQVEFTDQVAQFFRDAERDGEIVSIRVAAKGPDWSRPLTYRGTDYGQWTEIWRLGLPTPGMKGPAYPGRVIRLERLEAGGNTVYRLHVTDDGSKDAALWRANAGSNVATTSGPLGRDFGYW
jgi:hypothetical protein